jgi:hypothetical protein
MRKIIIETLAALLCIAIAALIGAGMALSI